MGPFRNPANNPADSRDGLIDLPETPDQFNAKLFPRTPKQICDENRLNRHIVKRATVFKKIHSRKRITDQPPASLLES